MKKNFAVLLLCCLLPACSPSEAENIRADRYSLMMIQKLLAGQGYSARCEVESMDYADQHLIAGPGHYESVLREIGSSEKEPFALMGNRDNTCSYNGKIVKPAESYQDIENAKNAELKKQWQELAAGGRLIMRIAAV